MPSAIIFKRKAAFCAIKLRKDSILIEWTTDRFADEEFITKHFKMSTNRVVHTARIAPDVLDVSDLKSLLLEAYQVATPLEEL